MITIQPTRSSWIPQRIPAVGRGGMVAAKMPQAADAGIAMLRKGGNAVDAAVATAFAIGVVEPHMNGIGGGGYMVVWLAKEQRSLVIDFPMISAAAASPEMFRLAPSGTGDGFLFGWPSTVNDENVIGYRSIAVPGTVAGLALALERHGTLSLAEVLAPAITLAEEGFPVTWQTTLHIAKALATLTRFPATAEIFLDAHGAPLATSEQVNPTLIRQPDLARTLRTIADQGPRAFYEGELARRITTHLQENDSPITADDFATYQAREIHSLTVDYHSHQVHTIGGATGGTSLAEALVMLNELDPGTPGNRSAGELHMMTQVFRQAFADRFAYLADPDHIAIPQDALLDPAYARERISTFDPDRATTPTPGDRGRLGVRHTMPASVPEYVRSGSTTHLGTMDAEGNAVSLTQTLLALWGSRVTIPGTGILMNNGMMWFDPEPGRPNSVGGRKKPLSNMAPAIVTKGNEVLASIGSSGGRRIQNCNAQIIMNVVDGEMIMQEAVDTPRIDTSTKALAISTRVDPTVIDALAAMGHPVSPRDESQMTSDFASPVAIRRTGDTFDGGADPWYASATTAALEEV